MGETVINGVHHVALSTGDLDRLVAFYTEHLGFEVVMDTAWSDRPAIDDILGLKGTAARQKMLRAGNAYVEVFEFSAPEPEPGDPKRPVCNHGYTHFCLDVTDIDAEYERLSAAGMTFHCPPAPSNRMGSGKLRATYGRDPDGNVIELQEVLDPSIPFSLQQLGVGPGADPGNRTIRTDPEETEQHDG